LETPN